MGTISRLKLTGISAVAFVTLTGMLWVLPAIATVMVLGGKAKDLPQKVGVHAAVFAVSLLTFLILRSSVWVSTLLGRTGINVVVRIMGPILAAVAMQFVIDGLHSSF